MNIRKTQQTIYITANTTCNPVKSKSGDASFADVLNLNNKEIFVLIVADGVSRSPKDWLASASIVKLIIEFIKANPTIQFPDLLKRAILHANNTIISGIDDTIGMLSTLSILVFMPDTQTIYTSNIGDSRIYGYKHKTWHQLTVDDTTTKVYKENGKIKLQNGAPVMRSSLTKAIGGNNNLDIDIKILNARDYAGYCLVSDGFYEMPDWEKSMDLIYAAADMQKTIQELTPHFKDTMKDDASVAILRIPPTVFNLDAIFNSVNLIEDTDISKAVLLPQINEIINNAAENREEEKIAAVLQWMQVNNLSFSKEKMIVLLDMVIANNYLSLINTLRNIIRNV